MLISPIEFCARASQHASAPYPLAEFVTVIDGRESVCGSADRLGNDASFDEFTGIVAGADGRLFITDTYNQAGLMHGTNGRDYVSGSTPTPVEWQIKMEPTQCLVFIARGLLRPRAGWERRGGPTCAGRSNTDVRRFSQPKEGTLLRACFLHRFFRR